MTDKNFDDERYLFLKINRKDFVEMYNALKLMDKLFGEIEVLINNTEESE